MEKYWNTVTYRSGTRIEGATIEVLDSGGALTEIFSDENGSSSLGTSTTTDENGFYQFYVADGTYSIRHTFNGVSETITGIEIYDRSQMRADINAADSDKATAAALGVAADAEDMGTFTGSTISDNVTAKAAIQALETAVETKANASAVGVTASAANMGTFTGSTIPDNETAKQNIQSLETALEVVDDNLDDAVAASGIALGAQNYGTFTGATISDSQTAKQALQALETAVEARVARATTRAAMDDFITTAFKSVHLEESGREGLFVWSSANNSANVTADPAQAIYVPPSSDTTGASGAWVRKFSGPVDAKWFGAVGDGTDDTTALLHWLNSPYTSLLLSEGDFRIVDGVQDGTPVLLSSVSNRTFEGPGRITAETEVYVAMRISGDNCRVSNLTFAGNNKIMSALSVTGSGCQVIGCQFLDLFAPLNIWQSIAIWANFDGGDKNILITGNIFRNIEAIGDGTAGNGLGLSRAVQLSGNQNITKASIISNNIIQSVIGEEGDAISAISFDGATTYFDFPVLITGNTVTTWTRRAIKIQSNSAIIKGNLLQNTLSVDPGNMQHAISLIQGGNHVVDGNTLVNCRYGSQINLNAADSSERVDNIVITNNVIRDIGAETTAIPIFVDSFGENVVVANNAVLCPNHAPTNVIVITNALSGYVGGNIIDTASTLPYLFTASVNLLLDISSDNTATHGQRTINTNGDALGLQVSGATNRSLTLYNYDTTLSVGEVISRIRFHQNDASSDLVTASIRAVAVGSSGGTKIVVCTGAPGGTQDTARWGFGITGDFVPEADNTYDVGTSAARVAQSYVVQRYWTSTVFDSSGTGTPEGAVTAGIGSTFRRTDGGAATSFYVKESGTGNTGWVGK